MKRSFCKRTCNCFSSLTLDGFPKTNFPPKTTFNTEIHAQKVGSFYLKSPDGRGGGVTNMRCESLSTCSLERILVLKWARKVEREHKTTGRKRKLKEIENDEDSPLKWAGNILILPSVWREHAKRNPAIMYHQQICKLAGFHKNCNFQKKT